MKKFIFVFVFALSLATASAQDVLHCATDVVMGRLYEKHPEMKQQRQKLDQLRLNHPRRPATTNYVIPVVFHILHVNGPENISDEQVKDAVRILNRDYAKRNADTTDIIPEFKNLADSAGIRFVLASKDPSGNCTNGIVHYYDTDTDWDDTSPTLYSHTWDPTMYMNVYIVRTITLGSGFGAAGYTFFPGTWLPGDPWDAIVVLNNYFGSIGTGSDFLSRVLTHEAGHWLGLYHVFGPTNGAGIDCSGDDLVNDTPTTIGYLNCPNAAVPSQYQICTPGASENYQNYMDYSYCCRMFTQGQCNAMQGTLQSNVSGRDNVWSNTNLIATGVLNPNTLCAPIADFKYNRSKTCAGTPVTFTDASWNGVATSYNWTFAGGTPAVSTQSAPVVTYANPGIYSITYSSSNSAGASTPVTKGNIIIVTSGVANYAANNWSEGFENLPQVNSDWTFKSSSGAENWQQSSEAAYTGSYSAKLDKENNTRRNVTAMTSPAVNLASVPNPVLTFKLAAAEVTPNYINTLKVFYSTDCGATWTQAYSKTGQALITSASTATDFIPSGHSEWRTESISLTSISGAAYVNFKFEYTRDTIPAANNVFLDDINISAATAIKQNKANAPEAFMVFPNPSRGAANISFSLLTKQTIKLTLSDLLGRQLETLAEQEMEPGGHVQALDVSSLPAGVYFLKLEVSGAAYTRKLIEGVAVSFFNL